MGFISKKTFKLGILLIIVLAFTFIIKSEVKAANDEAEVVVAEFKVGESYTFDDYLQIIEVEKNGCVKITGNTVKFVKEGVATVKVAKKSDPNGKYAIIEFHISGTETEQKSAVDGIKNFEEQAKKEMGKAMPIIKSFVYDLVIPIIKSVLRIIIEWVQANGPTIVSNMEDGMNIIVANIE